MLLDGQARKVKSLGKAMVDKTLRASILIGTSGSEVEIRAAEQAAKDAIEQFIAYVDQVTER